MHCKKIAIDLLAIKELQNIHMKLCIRIKTYTEHWQNNRQNTIRYTCMESATYKATNMT